MSTGRARFLTRVFKTAGMAVLNFAPGCQTLPAPPTSPIPVTANALPTAPLTVEGDTASHLARSGINLSLSTILAFQDVSALLRRLEGLKATFPARAFGLLQSPEWSFLDGWYTMQNPDDSRTIRVRPQSSQGATVPWDLTLESNYAPDMHGSFPGSLNQVFLELEHWQATLAERSVVRLWAGRLGWAESTPTEFVGSGSITRHAPPASISIESLNLSVWRDGRLDHGVVVLRHLAAFSTWQFQATLGQAGVEGPAEILVNGTRTDTVAYENGQWMRQTASTGIKTAL